MRRSIELNLLSLKNYMSPRSRHEAYASPLPEFGLVHPRSWHSTQAHHTNTSISWRPTRLCHYSGYVEEVFEPIQCLAVISTRKHHIGPGPVLRSWLSRLNIILGQVLSSLPRHSLTPKERNSPGHTPRAIRCSADAHYTNATLRSSHRTRIIQPRAAPDKTTNQRSFTHVPAHHLRYTPPSPCIQLGSVCQLWSAVPCRHSRRAQS